MSNSHNIINITYKIIFKNSTYRYFRQISLILFYLLKQINHTIKYFFTYETELHASNFIKMVFV